MVSICPSTPEPMTGPDSQASASTSWSFLHLYSDEEGLSRVDPGLTRTLTSRLFAPPAPPVAVATASEATALVLLELPVGWHGGWHPSPQAQWVIALAGEMGFEAGDGSRFTLRPGSCALTTDTTGQGHDSWNAGNAPVRLALVQIPASWAEPMPRSSVPRS